MFKVFHELVLKLLVEVFTTNRVCFAATRLLSDTSIFHASVMINRFKPAPFIEILSLFNAASFRGGLAATRLLSDTSIFHASVMINRFKPAPFIEILSLFNAAFFRGGLAATRLLSDTSIFHASVMINRFKPAPFIKILSLFNAASFRGGLKRSVRTVQLFGRLALLEPIFCDTLGIIVV